MVAKSVAMSQNVPLSSLSLCLALPFCLLLSPSPLCHPLPVARSPDGLFLKVDLGPVLLFKPP
eukprot:3183707-Rhodomonas_salina.1